MRGEKRKMQAKNTKIRRKKLHKKQKSGNRV